MKLSELFEIHRKLDLILRTLGVDPDVDRPQGIYCVVGPKSWLLFRGDYYACLEYLDRVGYGLKLDMMDLDKYNQLLDKAGSEI